MADELLVTVAQLSTWVTPDHDANAIAADDPWANAVLVEASNVVRSVAGHDDWLAPEDAPTQARTICLRVARRTYLNPDLVVSEGATGPIGGDTYAQAAALGTELSPQERADLEQFVDTNSDTAGFWKLGIGNGDPVTNDVIYLADDQQTNLPPDEMPWEIPYLDAEEFDTAMTPP